MDRFIIYAIRNLGVGDSVMLQGYPTLIIERTNRGMYTINFTEIDKKIGDFFLETVVHYLRQKYGNTRKISVNIWFNKEKYSHKTPSLFSTAVRNRKSTDVEYRVFIERNSRKISQELLRRDLEKLNKQYFSEFLEKREQSISYLTKSMIDKSRQRTMEEEEQRKTEKPGQPIDLEQQKRVREEDEEKGRRRLYRISQYTPRIVRTSQPEYPVVPVLPTLFSPEEYPRVQTKLYLPEEKELCPWDMFVKLWDFYEYGPIIASLCYSGCLINRINMKATAETWIRLKQEIMNTGNVWLRDSEANNPVFMSVGDQYTTQIDPCFYEISSYNFLVDFYERGGCNCECGSIFGMVLSKIFPPSGVAVLKITPGHTNILLFSNGKSTDIETTTIGWTTPKNTDKKIIAMMYSEKVIAFYILLVASRGKINTRKIIEYFFSGSIFEKICDYSYLPCDVSALIAFLVFPEKLPERFFDTCKQDFYDMQRMSETGFEFSRAKIVEPAEYFRDLIPSLPR